MAFLVEGPCVVARRSREKLGFRRHPVIPPEINLNLAPNAGHEHRFGRAASAGSGKRNSPPMDVNEQACCDIGRDT